MLVVNHVYYKKLNYIVSAISSIDNPDCSIFNRMTKSYSEVVRGSRLPTCRLGLFDESNDMASNDLVLDTSFLSFDDMFLSKWKAQSKVQKEFDSKINDLQKEAILLCQEYDSSPNKQNLVHKRDMIIERIASLSKEREQKLKLIEEFYSRDLKKVQQKIKSNFCDPNIVDRSSEFSLDNGDKSNWETSHRLEICEDDSSRRHRTRPVRQTDNKRRMRIYGGRYPTYNKVYG